MEQKPVLMIHEVDERLFELPLADYVLTFDDGLYSQYHYFQRINEIDTQKIFFISTNIICIGDQSTEYISSKHAHDKYFETGNAENFMTLAQIKELMGHPQVIIGGHSHNHTDIRNMKLVERLTLIRKDTELMVTWFETNLGFRPRHFCFPYNNNSDGLYNAALKEYGIVKCHGRERIPVETLLQKMPQLASHAA